MCNIRSNGFTGCDYTNLTVWSTAIKSDLTSTQSLLFTMANLGNYAASDDGGAVVFTGGGTGVLKHISVSGIAYVTGCKGLIQAGTVSNKTTQHTFAISDTGNPIVTAVAQCYNDWPNGLKDSPTIIGWTANSNHCVTIRAAPGQGHTGNLKNDSGLYSGFTLKGKLDFNATPYTRIERIADDGFGINGCGITIGSSGSVNRVLDIGTVTTQGSGTTIANSIFTTIADYWNPSTDIGLYNCTAQTFNLRDFPKYRHRAINCLAWATNGAAFLLVAGNGNIMYWLNHCVSADNSTTNYDTWQEGNAGNLANTTVTFVNAASSDFHLATTDTGARAKGVPGLGADICGNVRTGLSYDVGAAQSLSAPASNPPQLQSGPTALPNPAATNAVVQFTFTASDIDGNALTNYWTFGDGTIGAPQPAFITNHIYNAIGTYTAQVTISDGTLATTGSVVVNVLSGFALWQIANFGSTNAQGSASNAVNSAGISNYQLFLAGSNPMNPSTWFLFTGITPATGSGCGLNFNTVSGKSYTVTWKTNLLDGLGWQFYTNFGSSGGSTNVAFPNGLPQAFFQIQAQ